MKRLILIMGGLFLLVSVYAQTKLENETKAVKLIEETLKNMNSAWSELKLIKHDRIDTLYILPTESKEYIKANADFEVLKNNAGTDSTSFYIKAMTKAMADKNDKLYQKYQKKVDEWQAKNGNNTLESMRKLAQTVVSYTRTQKGWKMRCRILSNAEEENVEFHFDMDLSQVTDVITAQYAIIYEKMQKVETPEEFWILKRRFDNRRKI